MIPTTADIHVTRSPTVERKASEALGSKDKEKQQNAVF